MSAPEAERRIQAERTFVVGCRVDHGEVGTAPPHPGDGIDGECSAEALTLGGGVDRETLEVTRGVGDAADGERREAPIGRERAGTVSRGRRDHIGEGVTVVAPRRRERTPIDSGGLVELVGTEPADTSRRSGARAGTGDRAGAGGPQVEFEERQAIDRSETHAFECDRRLGEQRSGSDRHGGLPSCVVDPCLHVSFGGHHLVVEEHEVHDLGFVRPGTRSGPNDVVDAGDVHGRDGTRSRPFAALAPITTDGGCRNLAAMLPARFDPVLRELAPIAERFRARGHRLYLVGGSVRDLLIRDDLHDFDLDLTTDARPDEIKKCLHGWADALWTQGERFGTIGAHRIHPDTGVNRVFEVTTFRSEAYTDDSRKPHVVFADDVESDLARRDFTVNAMALELTGVSGDPELIDPFGGVADLATKTLRTPIEPHVSFGDDPLRMMRAARFIAGHQLQPTDDVVAAVRSMVDRLAIVSPERIRDEFDKLIVVDHPSAGLWFLVETGLAEQFLPELPAMRLEHDPIHRHKDVLTHTIAVVENVRRPTLSTDAADVVAPPPFDFRITRLAALFHDIGKPRTRGYLEGKGTTFHHHDAVGARMTRKRMTAMRYSNDDIAAVTELVALHLRFHTYAMGWSDAAVRRYVRDAGDLLAELNVLTRCDCTTRNENKAARLSRRMDDLEDRIRELGEAEELASIRPELDGNEVMELLGVPPGRAVGTAMRFLLDVRLDEGVLGDDAIRARLLDWWTAQTSS